jgi:biopolymer transport protein ExbB
MKRHRVIEPLVCGVCLFICLQKGMADENRPGAATLEQAVEGTLADIERDTDALNALRAEIAEQRRPLAARRDALQKTVREDRAEVERIRRLRRQGENEQASLEAEMAAVEEESRFLAVLFVEHSRAMETRVGPAEAARLAERLRPIQQALAEEEADGFADAVSRLLALSAELNADRFGGALFDGVALDADGIERPGRFASLGPAAYFAAGGEGPAGLATAQFGASQPAIYDRFPPAVAAAIRTLAAGDAARVPVDVTGGDAIQVAEARTTLLQHWRKGGFVMIPLLAVALAAVVLAIWKTLELALIQVKPGPQLEAAVDAARRGEAAAAREAAAGIRQPLRSLVEEAIEHRHSARDHLEEIMYEHVLAALPRLERHLGTLAVLGGIAPLLGLLGTVTGMIHTFQLVTIFGSGDAKLLSGGISEALITTETGLAIAIPVLLVHAFLARRARGVIGALERAAVGIVNRLAAGSPVE